MKETEVKIVRELNLAKRKKDNLLQSKKLATRADLKCPACQSTKFTLLQAKRSFLNKSNAFYLLVGLLIFVVLQIAEAPPGSLQEIWPFIKVCGYIIGAILIWDGALGLGAPPPFIWFEDFGQKTYEIQAKCNACNKHWSKIIRLRYLKHGEFEK